MNTASSIGDRCGRRGLAGRFGVGVLAVAVQAAPAFGVTSTVLILARRPAAEAPAAVRAYAEAFRSVGYPVEWVDGLREGRAGDAVLVVPHVEAEALGAEASGRIAAFVSGGGRLVTAGESPLARALGVRFAREPLEIRGVVEALRPDLEIRWHAACRFLPFAAPEGARTYAWAGEERRPIVVSFQSGAGVVLLLGVELGGEAEGGGARFPYLLQAAGEAFRIGPPLARHRLVAYADIADRRGEDPVAVARRWHEQGIREVHLSAWPAFDGSQAVFSALISACHRYGILVYAWLEPPEVSSGFWEAHPEWREKTATGADARVDWRRLMALNVPECFAAVARGLQAMLAGFDWDGVDLAELYYESPMGLEAPQLFTPMNALVREEFARRAGFDPRELFVESSPRYREKDGAALEAFLAYRREKIVELHGRLMELLASARRPKPHLDLVLTLVDALYDERMRDRIAIDTDRITALAVKEGFALQVEDPYTLWALGPERYRRIASDYARRVGPTGRLSIDVNVVPRGEDAFPTSQQTGLELYRLVSEARQAFPKVCIYSEASLYEQDLPLLPSAFAAGARIETTAAGHAVVESEDGVELVTGDPPSGVRVDGAPWPVVRGSLVLLPAGRHLVEWEAGPSAGEGTWVLDINARLLGARIERGVLTVRYASPARAFLTLSFRPARVRVDGRPVGVPAVQNELGFVVVAPPGEHTVELAIN